MNCPKSLSVLLVDDSTVIRRWWVTLLSGISSLQVAGEAANGTEALDLFERLRPDAVILDVEMPGESGLDVLREIRKRDSACFVIMTSSYREEGYEGRCYEQGADYYFAKIGGADGFVDVLKARLGQ